MSRRKIFKPSSMALPFRTEEDDRRPSRDEWRGWRFFLISIVVTTVSIIFFFSGVWIFSRMNSEAPLRSAVMGAKLMARRVVEWGGVKLTTIDLQVVAPEGQATWDGGSVAIFDPAAERLKRKLASYYGMPFWLVDLSQLRDEILAEGWARHAYLRRSFPDRLSIQIVPRVPELLMRAAQGWALLDGEGFVALVTPKLSGVWAHLPVVTGYEEIFRTELSPSEMNRRLEKDREILVEFLSLKKALATKVGMNVESVQIRRDLWTDTPLFDLRWTRTRSPESGSLVFLSGQWQERLTNLQFVMSDLKERKMEDVRILGQYHGRFIVDSGERE